MFVTLKKSWEFKRVRQEGRKFPCASFIIEVCPPADKHQAIPRVGFIASKRLGNAVQRNYAKRRLRALWRHALPKVTIPSDYVLIAKPQILTILFAQLEQELYKVLSKIEKYDDSKHKKYNS